MCVAQQLLLEQNKAMDTARMAAFTKSLTCAALHLDSGAAMGVLSLLNMSTAISSNPLAISAFRLDGQDHRSTEGLTDNTQQAKDFHALVHR